ncbi:MAG: GHKL domain-containing protein [Phycisphaerales bacterium]|nr:GHKL domain-containing protein [Phycisphaerales bacterium]
MKLVIKVIAMSQESALIARLLLIGRWLSVIAAAALAGVIVWRHFVERDIVLSQITTRNLLKLANTRSEIESYLNHVEITLRTIASEPSIRHLRTDSRDYVQTIYDSNYDHHMLAEVYVVERGFDGSRRPFMTFERAEQGIALEDLHTQSREADEYREQISQIARFAADPKLCALLSGRVPLCLGEPGLVYSTPIRAEGELRGLVAGMIRSKTLDQLLDSHGDYHRAALFDERGELIAAARVSDDEYQALPLEIRTGTAHSATIQTDHVISTPISEPPAAAGCTLVMLHDPAGQLSAAGVTGLLSAWGPAAAILALGALAALLCHVALELIAARHVAVARTEQLAHATRVATLGELAAGIAHELNQPLAAISTYAEAAAGRLRNNQLDPHETLTDLAAINTQANRAATIIERLRAFIRKRPTQRQPVDIAAIAREAARLVEIETRRANVTIQFAIDPLLPGVNVDEVQLMQVFVNLLRNAIEAVAAAPSASREVRIRITRAAASIECRVEDSGPPIPEERFDRLFIPFESTKDEGLGLGLAISQTIVNSFSGRIRAERNARGGLTMCFSLPTGAQEGAT